MNLARKMNADKSDERQQQEERILAQGIITGMNLARQMHSAEANTKKIPLLRFECSGSGRKEVRGMKKKKKAPAAKEQEPVELRPGVLIVLDTRQHFRKLCNLVNRFFTRRDFDGFFEIGI